ncbi:MAG: hypothetical protein SGARI_005081, partial [Bacillariaceae sp.]
EDKDVQELMVERQDEDVAGEDTVATHVEEEKMVPEWTARNSASSTAGSIHSSGDGMVCDRRLSRAARRGLRKHLLHSIFRNIQETERDDVPSVGKACPDDTVHELLDRWLTTVLSDKRKRSPASCHLQPSRDIYKQDEEHSRYVSIQSLPGGPSKNLKIAYPNYVLQYRDNGNQQTERWYQCDYCGKTFTSQFYLDLHMNSKHRKQHQTQSNDGEFKRYICPATEWCNLIGVANCHRHALQDEPYYNQGNNGWGNDVGATL